MPEEKRPIVDMGRGYQEENPEVDFSDEDVLYELSMKGYDEEHE